MAVDIWLTSGLPDILVMGNPNCFPDYILRAMGFCQWSRGTKLPTGTAKYCCCCCCLFLTSILCLFSILCLPSSTSWLLSLSCQSGLCHCFCLYHVMSYGKNVNVLHLSLIFAQNNQRPWVLQTSRTEKTSGKYRPLEFTAHFTIVFQHVAKSLAAQMFNG